jgi:hypothetical protein
MMGDHQASMPVLRAQRATSQHGISKPTCAGFSAS